MMDKKKYLLAWLSFRVKRPIVIQQFLVIIKTDEIIVKNFHICFS